MVAQKARGCPWGVVRLVAARRSWWLLLTVTNPTGSFPFTQPRQQAPERFDFDRTEESSLASSTVQHSMTEIYGGFEGEVARGFA